MSSSGTQQQQQAQRQVTLTQPESPLPGVSSRTSCGSVSDNNWHVWHIEMEAILTALGLRAAIKPPSNHVVQQGSTLDTRAIALLILNVPPELHHLVSEASSAQHAWHKLGKHFASNAAQRQTFLTAQLGSLLSPAPHSRMRQQPGEPIKPYFARVRQLALERRAAGMHDADNLAQAAVLGVLPEFNSAADAAIHNVLPQHGNDLTALERHFQQAEQRLELSGQLPAPQSVLAHLAVPALTSRSAMRGGRGGRSSSTAAGQRGISSTSRGRGRTQQQHTGRVQPTGRQPGWNGLFKPGVVCLACTKEGHYQNRCPTYSMHLKPQPRQQPAAQLAALPSMTAAVPPQQASSAQPGPWIPSWLSTTVEPSSKTERWVVDSGAAAHVCHDRTAFSSMQSTAAAGIVTSSGAKQPAAGEGTVVLSITAVDGTQHAVQLESVLYVPTATANLLSTQQHTSKGNHIHLHSGTGHIISAGFVAALVPQFGLLTLPTLSSTQIAAAGEPAVMQATRQPAPPLSSEASVEASIKPMESSSAHTQHSSTPMQHSSTRTQPSSAPRTHHSTLSTPTPLAFGGRTFKPLQLARAQLWHRRMGHIGSHALAQLPRMAGGLDISTDQVQAAAARSPPCATCLSSKQHAQPSPSSQHSTNKPLQLLHSDVCGPIHPPAQHTGAHYFMTVLDDFSGYSVVSCIKSKAEAATALQRIINMFERQLSSTVQTVRSDRGGEYMSKAMHHFFSERGMVHQLSAPGQPQQNGKAERLNRTLLERTRALLHDSQLPHSLWDFALEHAAYLRNRAPAAGKSATPHELLWGEQPSLERLRVFGCTAYAHVPREQRSTKLASTTHRGLFVGLDSSSKAYKILSSSGRLIITPHAEFDETQLPAAQLLAPTPPLHVLDEPPHDTVSAVPYVPAPVAPSTHAPQPAHSQQPATSSTQQSTQPSTQQSTQQSTPPSSSMPTEHSSHNNEQTTSAHSSTEHNSSMPDSSIEQSSEAGESEQPRRSQRQHRPPAWLQGMSQPHGRGWRSVSMAAAEQENSTTVSEQQHYCAALTAGARDFAALSSSTESEPLTAAEAMRRPDAAEWRRAMEAEMESLQQHDTWNVEKTPTGVQPLPVRWVFKIKEEADGSKRYKARLVAKGFRQREGVDFEDVFAPVSKGSTLRALLSVVAVEDLHLHQLDIKTAFLNGKLTEEVWVEQPEGFQQQDSSFSCHLQRALYGLKQAPRAWFTELRTALQQLGFQQSAADPALFSSMQGEHSVIILVYVDDLLIAASSMPAITTAKQSLLQRFEGRDLGEAKCFLGLEISRDRQRRTLSLHQHRYSSALVARTGLQHSKPNAVPYCNSKLSSTGEPLDAASQQQYSSIVGSLMYAVTCTRPDMAFSVGSLARFMARPTQQHMVAAKSAVRYLAGTAHYGLLFGSSKHSLTAYSDADFAGCPDTYRSTTGYTFLLHGASISWSSKRQPVVSVSTAEAEYYAAAAAVREAAAMRKLNTDLPLLNTNSKAFSTASSSNPAACSSSTVPLCTDNQATAALLHNQVSNHRAKHIGVQYSFAREAVERGEVAIHYVPSGEQLADILTKPLQVAKFSAARAALGVLPVA